MSAQPQEPLLPDSPATPSLDDSEAHALQKRINKLIPRLYKEDATPELSGLLGIISTARAMGAEGFAMLKKLAEQLREMRVFDDLYILTSEMNANGMGDPKVRIWEIQALIEMKVYETALDLARPLISKGVNDKTAREAYGLIGRIYKQMFVDTYNDPNEKVERAVLQLYLQRSFNAYMHVWDRLKTPETAWQGVNALAVAHMATRLDFTGKDPQAEQLANDIIKIAGGKDRDEWSLASVGEAWIGLGDEDKAMAAYTEYARQPSITPFNIAASLRQLEEVWGLNGSDAETGAPVRLLKTALLAKVSEMAGQEREAGGDKPKASLHALEVSMTTKEAGLIRRDVLGLQSSVTGTSKQALQKTFSDSFPTGVRQVRLAMLRADSVCRIHTMKGGVSEGFGTGFAIKGSVLNPAWGDKPVIVTNNHIISSRPSADCRAYDLCEAVFVSPEDDSETIVKFDGILWESDINEHDVTILRASGDLPKTVTPLDTLTPRALGQRASNDDGIGRCYVIGFPGAKELAFSFADNIVLDHDCPDGCKIHDHEGHRTSEGVTPNPVRIHYRTPTIGGSSGSPVFDGEFFQLMGVHHAGAPNMQRLNGREGSYAANEGIWIDSIRQAIAETPNAASAEAWTGAPVRWRSFNDDSIVKPAAIAPSADLVAKVLPASVSAAASVGTEIPGSSGEPNPGVSPVARQVMYKPGKADPADIRAARLESVIGHDNRTRIFDTGMAPWRMICAIRARWGSRLMVGTGCFIGPNTILTAGHVVFPREFGQLPDTVEVIPGLNGNETPYGVHKAAKISVHPGWNGPFAIHNDVAAIHLAEPVGRKVGWFGVATRTKDQLKDQWAHVTGYPGEKKEEADARGISETAPAQAAQLWHHAAPVTSVDNNRIFYAADTTAGQSGAPIYVLREEGNFGVPVVVGVHAYGTRSTPGSVGPANSGAWIDEDMLKIISMWRTV